MTGSPEDNNTQIIVAGELSTQPQLIIDPPSAEAEWLRIQNYFTHPLLYEIYNYLPKLPLPEQPPFPYYISRLMGRDHQRPSEAEFALLRQTFYDEVFDENTYDTGLQLLQQCTPTLESQVFPIMSGHQATLGFYIPPHGYKITLSRFGTTGSYRTQGKVDEMQGEVTVLFTGVEDSQVLLERLVHEIVHIGFAQRLIRAGDFNHDQKESVIDDYTTAHFKHLLPDYERQGSQVLDRDKFQRLLHTVVYAAMLEGVELPTRPDGDAEEVRKLLGTYSIPWWITDVHANHRNKSERVNKVLKEHGWTNPSRGRGSV